MKKITLLLILAILFMLSGCDNPVAVNVKLNEEFKLKVGQNAKLQNESLRIKFVAVTEDSRCPLIYRCDSPGNAAVALTIQKDNYVPAIDTLNTYSYPRTNWYLGYKIDLAELEPYPQDYTPIPKLDYVATFVIKNALLD